MTDIFLIKVRRGGLLIQSNQIHGYFWVPTHQLRNTDVDHKMVCLRLVSVRAASWLHFLNILEVLLQN